MNKNSAIPKWGSKAPELDDLFVLPQQEELPSVSIKRHLNGSDPEKLFNVGEKKNRLIGIVRVKKIGAAGEIFCVAHKVVKKSTCAKCNKNKYIVKLTLPAIT